MSNFIFHRTIVCDKGNLVDSVSTIRNWLLKSCSVRITPENSIEIVPRVKSKTLRTGDIFSLVQREDGVHDILIHSKGSDIHSTFVQINGATYEIQPYCRELVGDTENIGFILKFPDGTEKKCYDFAEVHDIIDTLILDEVTDSL